MSTTETVLAAARKEIGYREGPNNDTKFGIWYGMNRVAWCAIFLQYVFAHTDAAALIPKTAYTPTFADWFRARKQWGTEPRPGAVVFFDFPNDGVNRISHVGIVESVAKDGSVITIEGNTSSGSAGSQRDGGGVWRRTRRVGIVGYGYPAYSGVVLPAPSRPAAPSTGTRRATIRRGDRGPDVEFVHRFLGVVPPSSSEYGIFGPKTETAVKRYQQMRGITADGVVGPNTWREMGQ